MGKNESLACINKLLNSSSRIELNWIEFAWRKYNNKIIFEHIPTNNHFLVNDTMFEIFDGFKKSKSITSVIENYKNKFKVDEKVALEDLNIIIEKFDEVGLIKKKDYVKNIIETSRKNNTKNNESIDDFTRKEVSKYLQDEFPYCPFQVEFDLTYRCNAKCIHCMYHDYATKENEELTTDEIENVLSELVKNGSFILSFSGGEVTIRRDFLKIIKQARNLGFHVSFLSNGILLGQNIELLEEITKQFPASISISLHGSTSETHDNITRIKGSYDNAIRAIEFLVDKNIHVEVRSTITDKNFAEFSNIAKLCSKLKVKLSAGLYILPSLTGNLETTKFNLRGNKLKKALKKNYEVFNIQKLTIPAKMCSAGSSRVCITPIGDVKPCNSINVTGGNIRNDAFSNIWHNSGFFKLFRNLSDDNFYVCKDCKYSAYCTVFCVGANCLWNGDIFKPPELTCEYAKINYEIMQERV